MKQVKICEKSKKMIDETFNMYETRKWDWYDVLKFNNRVILHLYPENDTINDNDDESTGYIDGLEFKLKVFDCKDRKCYETYCDSICFDDAFQYTRIKVFKDQSTMIIIEQPCEIHSGHTVFIRKGENK